MDYQAIVSGIFGLFFYEGLRIYKCTTVGKHPIPNNRIGWHIVGLTILGFVAATLAVQFAKEEFVEGLILGFAVPSGLKAVLASESKPDQSDDMWSYDTSQGDAKTMPKFAVKALAWANSYFDSRWRG